VPYSSTNNQPVHKCLELTIVCLPSFPGGINMSFFETVKKINLSLSAAFVENDRQEKKAVVCLVCDRFIKPKWRQIISLEELLQNTHLLTPVPTTAVPEELQRQYEINLPSIMDIDGTQLLRNCALSPRATYIDHIDGRRTNGYTICGKCKSCLLQHRMPSFCIANNYLFGETPSCLL
jgi:hypothetical protein